MRLVNQFGFIVAQIIGAGGHSASYPKVAKTVKIALNQRNSRKNYFIL
jgi:hypothetical protein